MSEKLVRLADEEQIDNPPWSGRVALTRTSSEIAEMVRASRPSSGLAGFIGYHLEDDGRYVAEACAYGATAKDALLALSELTETEILRNALDD